MTQSSDTARRGAATENSVPLFWPIELAAALAQSEMDLFVRGAATLAESEKLALSAPAQFATPNRIALELHTLRLRDFSDGAENGEVPTLIDAPFAGHSAVIADFQPSQSLVETLRANGLSRVFLTDWKSATLEMKDYDIDNYLAELVVCIDELGGRVNLVGLCQGGWMAAMLAARFPDKVRRLVLAGAPIDAGAGDGAIKRIARDLPMAQYESLIALGGGLMRGDVLLRAWKNMHPGRHYFRKYVDLYEHVDDPAYLKKQEAFEAWYENPIDLPGRWYLQVVKELFKENRLAEGGFCGLGRVLSLHAVACPVYLLAGAEDDITTPEQVFNAERLVGAPHRVAKALAPGGHIGLFMSARVLAEHWPKIARWIASAN